MMVTGHFGLAGALALGVLTAWSRLALAERLVVPVPRTVIYGGQTISDADLVDKSFSQGSINSVGVISARGNAVGRIAKRALLPGQPIAEGSTKAADVVRAGRPTKVVVEDGELSIVAIALPLQSAAPGEVVSFQNPDGGATLKGIAQEDGSIRMGSP
jgi:flagellar basal body P-ring formation protein FlgA